jgi:hypothetical protein
MAGAVSEGERGLGLHAVVVLACFVGCCLQHAIAVCSDY